MKPSPFKKQEKKYYWRTEEGWLIWPGTIVPQGCRPGFLCYGNSKEIGFGDHPLGWLHLKKETGLVEGTPVVCCPPGLLVTR